MKDKDLSAKLTHVIDQMYASRYFTNHGPLARQFEKKIAQKTKFTNAVAINNFEIALLIAINVQDNIGALYSSGNNRLLDNILTLSGLPSLTLREMANMKSEEATRGEGGQNIIYCSGNDRVTFTADMENNDQFTLIEHTNLAEFKYKHICKNYVAIVNLKEQFDLHHDFEGAVLLCDDDILSEKFRNMRSSYGTNEQINVKATCNGRFSEFQAGLYLQYI